MCVGELISPDYCSGIYSQPPFEVPDCDPCRWEELLIEIIKKYGTLPFAGLARCAFISQRILLDLKEMELIEQRYFARDHGVEYYEAVSKGEHYHFTCLGCRKIIEVETPKIRQVQEEFSTLTGAKFTHACVCFEGYCSNCVNEEEKITL